MKQLSSIGQVNFRKQRAMADFMQPTDYVNVDQVLGKNSSGMIQFGVPRQQRFVINVDQQESSDVNSAEINTANKDSYLKMMKNKEQFARKIQLGGGFEV